MRDKIEPNLNGLDEPLWLVPAHVNTEDDEYKGFTIPKGATVIAVSDRHRSKFTVANVV